MGVSLPGPSHLAVAGTCLSLRVTAGASRDGTELRDDELRVRATTAPEGGKADAAVRTRLAQALGVPKSRLRLVRGRTARDKVFEIS
ncbi:MAG: DUF167 domain-containing protein [Roseovarius sp.]